MPKISFVKMRVSNRVLTESHPNADGETHTFLSIKGTCMVDGKVAVVGFAHDVSEMLDTQGNALTAPHTYVFPNKCCELQYQTDDDGVQLLDADENPIPVVRIKGNKRLIGAKCYQLVDDDAGEDAVIAAALASGGTMEVDNRPVKFRDNGTARAVQDPDSLAPNGVPALMAELAAEAAEEAAADADAGEELADVGEID
jgi:hypothetical protein